MIPDTLLKTSSGILKIVCKSSLPTDLVLSKLLREKKYIGSKERKFISETVFTVLRNLSFLNKLSCSIFKFNIEINPLLLDEKYYAGMILSLLIVSNNDVMDFQYNPKLLLDKIYPNADTSIVELFRNNITEIAGLSENEISDWLLKTETIAEQLKIEYQNWQSSNSSYTISDIYSCPEWILEDVEKSGYNSAEFSRSLNKPAPVCLRVSDNAGLSAIENMLKSKEIPYRISSFLPYCIILDKRAKIDDTLEYKSGLFEIQDEGSQLIAYCLAPERGSDILDACAGAGGKTLHIADLCPDARLIVASDSEYLRLREFSKRAARYNKKNIAVAHAQNMKHTYLNELYKGKMFDYILVDAPCTGLGTARRDPLKKFKTTQKIADKMHSKQFEILTAYSRFLKPGGVIVYATCSVLRAENQDVIEEFLKENKDFEPDSLFDVLNTFNISVSGVGKDSYMVNLMPHIHGTDGFFMARMKRLD